MSFLKNVDTNLLLIGAVLGAGWWIQGGIAELKIEMATQTEKNAQMWMELKKDSDAKFAKVDEKFARMDDKFYEQLKEIRAISERVAVIESKKD